jgi:hypothetical protein
MHRHIWVYHKSYAQKHKIPNQENVNVPCEHCGEMFTRRDNVKKHQKNGKCPVLKGSKSKSKKS